MITVVNSIRQLYSRYQHYLSTIYLYYTEVS